MRGLLTLITLSTTVLVSQAQSPYDEKTKGATRSEGLFTTYLNPKENKLFLEILPDQFREFLFVSAIRTGLGSNDIGLDRGRLGISHVFILRRIADKVVFQVPNLAFRADNAGVNEAKAVAQSFAPSILWAGTVLAEKEDGTVLVDFSSLLLSDTNDVGGALSRMKEGTAAVDNGRSAIDFESCKSFPKNVEFESLLTFKVSGPGRFVRSTVPIPESWSIVQHTSIIELPDEKYVRRKFDPRVGAFGISYQDYAVPLTDTIQKRFVSRHRLEKTNPLLAYSSVVEPIVYYVDNGAPEPIRSALIEGASWWSEAFESAGFKDAFRVEILPDGIDPLDARYNVIQWVHRSTRGWSYGSSVTDPRTGEIIKGHVSLGSLRVRQDRLIFEGLLGTEKSGTGSHDDPVQLSLARIRQLAAHEVGHTLGLAHNFAASSYDRGSVMDYPSPRVTVKSGKIDVSDAYAVGMGAYDIHAIKWLYSQFEPNMNSEVELEKIIVDGKKRGLIFLSDGDCRSLGASDPRGSLWDDGSDPVEGLRNAMQVREIALNNFDLNRLPKGEPLSDLATVFVPIYLYHRYQVDAAVKAIGGVLYQHEKNGKNPEFAEYVESTLQRAALDALLYCLDDKFLAVPQGIEKYLVPTTYGARNGSEQFESRTTPAFDQISAAESAADLVFAGLLDPTRLERLVQQSEHNTELPSLSEVLSRTTNTVFDRSFARKTGSNLQWAVRRLYIDYLLRIDGDDSLTLPVRSVARAQILGLLDRLNRTMPAQELLHTEITRFLYRPAGSDFRLSRGQSVPPGSPIGSLEDCSIGG